MVGAIVIALSESTWIQVEGVLLVVVGFSGAMSAHFDQSTTNRTRSAGRPTWHRRIEFLAQTCTALVVLATALHTYRVHQWTAFTAAAALGLAVYWAVYSDMRIDEQAKQGSSL
ncbi:hypothetical protein [Rhodococcus jostii]|uniref:hypothetical protein n=1 Tax=Rhodococcus jostii TaxID=132919 RepID=UPI00362E5526